MENYNFELMVSVYHLSDPLTGEIRSTMTGVKHTQERIENMSRATRGKKLSQDHKDRIGSYWRGRSKPPRFSKSCVVCRREFLYDGRLDAHFEKAHG